MIVELKCCSMAHVIDRATAFLFCDPPCRVVAVKPYGVILQRPKGDTYFFRVARKVGT